MPLLLLRRIPGRLLLRHLFTRNHLSSRSQCRHIGSDTFIPPEMGFSKGFHQHYRLEKLLGSGTFADWVSMLAIGAEFKGGILQVFFLNEEKYSFSSSILDVTWLCTLRAILIFVQTTTLSSRKASKSVGYFSLLSLLFLSIKACANPQFSEEPLLCAFYITGISCALIEFIHELLIGQFSTTEPDLGSAPTSVAASEGVSVDGPKSLSLKQLLKVLRPYFWPTGLLNRLCVVLTWICLVGSKAANIVAPLYIAKEPLSLKP